ncbi:tetratricopeptide repeat protein [Chitinophaga lutea]
MLPLEETLQKAEFLIVRGKYDAAEELLKALLAQDPLHADVLHFFSASRFGREDYEGSLAFIEQAIGQRPQSAAFLFHRARIHIIRKNVEQAKGDLDAAMTINPSFRNSYSLYAGIHLQELNYEEAIAMADKALALYPEDVQALNIKSRAQLLVGQRENSSRTSSDALRVAPDNPGAHENYAWKLVLEGNVQGATEHFREALRLNPTSQPSRRSMAEFLKGRTPLYQFYLRYTFFLQSITGNRPWLLPVFLFFVSGALSLLALKVPESRPYATPAVAVLAIATFAAWMLPGISEWLLRFNKDGRHLLDRRKVAGANMQTLSMVIVAGSATALLYTHNLSWLAPMAYGIVMVGAMHFLFSEAPDRRITLGTILIAAVGAFAVYGAFFDRRFLISGGIAFLVLLCLCWWSWKWKEIREEVRTKGASASLVVFMNLASVLTALIGWAVSQDTAWLGWLLLPLMASLSSYILLNKAIPRWIGLPLAIAAVAGSIVFGLGSVLHQPYTRTAALSAGAAFVLLGWVRIVVGERQKGTEWPAIGTSQMTGVSSLVLLAGIIASIVLQSLPWLSLTTCGFLLVMPAQSVFYPGRLHWLRIALTLLTLALGYWSVETAFAEGGFLNRYTLMQFGAGMLVTSLSPKKDPQPS